MSLDENIYANFLYNFNEKMYKFKKNKFSELVFICIGTNKIIGDCFGPLVGQKLYKLFNNFNNIIILGTFKENICANNILKVQNYINTVCKNPYIIVIDAALSKDEDIGKIILDNRGINIGSCLNKKIYVNGDISIKGVVAKDYKIPKLNFKVLQNTSLNLVMDLAEQTAEGIYKVIKYN